MTTLRPGVEDDAEAVATFQTAAWNDAYRGLVPQEYLDGHTAADRVRRWRERLAAGERVVTVAEAERSIVGVSSSGDRDDGFELITLYVARSRWGTGLAVELLTAAIGERAACLWVFEENPRARAFYARHGFADDGGRQVDEGTGLWERRMRRG